MKHGSTFKGFYGNIMAVFLVFDGIRFWSLTP